MENLLLRWCMGIQDTTRLEDFENESGLIDLIWLAKLSIASFQKWFPQAKFLLLYNGDDKERFCKAFEDIPLSLFQPLEIIDQTSNFGKGNFKNPYSFVPQGVWWKWVPFRWDSDYHEISVDTDIVCINEPKDWINWLEGEEEVVVAPERFSEILVNTCGDFHNHPILKGKKPLNCGIVGHRAGHDYSKRFFEITNAIRYGYTRDSLFITEQGAINIWVYSLELDRIKPYVLDFEKCAWIRDFIYYLEKEVRVETIHAVAWHKRVAKRLGPILERKIYAPYPDDEFCCDLVETARKMDFYGQHLVRRQLGEDRKQVEFYF